ncbi:hypothetical protein [Bacillus sp. SJS]|uniref:hypothetical protein n=1 Tax=Bacillus sp. SJS TaxID=1423321 RepID=UPI0004DCC235|nr:hypothetical protein [Bacillus sp. SJS]KZZ84374.1 hypothetical protein AS29_010970 [Bacillus sp. SJS]
MAKAITSKFAKWPEQITDHIVKHQNEIGDDYPLEKVIYICEDNIPLYDDGDKTINAWNEISVPILIMSTVTFRNKYKRYLK